MSEGHRGLDPDARQRPQVRLRPLRMSDAPNVRRWMADPEFIRFTIVVPSAEYGELLPYSPAGADAYLDALIHGWGRRSYAIEWGDVHVGNIGLKSYFPPRTVAECFVEIGDSACRRHGVGGEAMRQLLDHGFDTLGLDTITLGVFEFNGPALALYARLGFVDDVDQGDHFVGGRCFRVLGKQLTAQAWRER